MSIKQYNMFLFIIEMRKPLSSGTDQLLFSPHYFIHNMSPSLMKPSPGLFVCLFHIKKKEAHRLGSLFNPGVEYFVGGVPFQTMLSCSLQPYLD